MTSQPLPASSGAFTRRRLWVAFAVILVAGAAGGAAFWARSHAKPDDDKPKVATLHFSPREVTKPLRAPMPQVVEFSGPLVAPGTAIVKAKANGTLLRLAVAEGSRVKAGQILGSIDLSEMQSRIVDRGALVESAQATLTEAERQHEANKRLADENFIAPTALQTSQAKLDAARAQLKSAQAQLAVSNIGVRDAALVAPISGIVGKRYVVPGERVSSEQNLLTIVDLSSLELAGNVGTHEVSLLEVGQPVQVRVEGRAEPVAGHIDRIAPSAEAGTRAIGVVVVLANKDERLRAGQYAQADVTLADATQRLTVPLSAISQASGQDQVWTIEKGALVRRIVVTGRKNVAGGRVEVLEGLVDTAVVLADRYDNLKEGAPAAVGGAPSAVPAVAASSAAAKS